MIDLIGSIIEKMNEKKIKFARLQFVDIHGIPKSISIPFKSDEDIENMFCDGVLFDGSSIDGFVEIEDSDLLMKPDPSTFSLLPWRPEDSGVCRFICDIYTPNGKSFDGDPRTILRRSLDKIKDKGYEYNIGPEPEFFIIDKDEEGNWIPHDKGRYFDVEPIDKGVNFRRKLILNLEELGFEVEASHHEGAPGQNEIAFKFDRALKAADAVITFKQAIKAIVSTMGYMVTFMPKPFFGVSGSGMHCHQSLFKGNKNLFLDENNETGLSKKASYFMGGLLKHSPALSAVVAPTVNSYKRLVPGYEAPVYISYGFNNRSTLIRIPAARGEGTRIEYRTPDPSCNPYLAFAAMLEAGLDGIKHKIDPGEPTEFNIYKLTNEEIKKKNIKVLPTSLWEAYHAYEENEIIKNSLGSHISEKFLESKYKEWDEYRIQVFGYEQKKYMRL